MKKIFQFGTCRTHQLNQFNDDNYCFINNIVRSHTTKETIQRLDWCANKNIDIIMIEISTLKVYFDENKYYFANDVVNNTGDKIIPNYIQDEFEFKSDIEYIYDKINLPILFIGHMDLDFHDLNNPSISNQRSKIDEYIKKYCKNFLILKEVFNGYDYKQICKDEKDTHHFSDFGYNILYKAVLNSIK